MLVKKCKNLQNLSQVSSGVPFLVLGVGAGIAKQYIQTGMKISII